MANLSPCFSTLEQRQPELFREVVNRQRVPQALLVQTAMRKRNVDYNPREPLETNCLKLLEALHVSLQDEPAAGAAAADMEVELQQVAAEAVPEPLPREVGRSQSGARRIRPAMSRPAFLVPVDGESTQVTAEATRASAAAEMALAELLGPVPPAPAIEPGPSEGHPRGIVAALNRLIDAPPVAVESEPVAAPRRHRRVVLFDEEEDLPLH